MVKKLLPHLKGVRRYVVLGPLFIIMEVILDVCIPLIMADIIDKGIRGGGTMEYILNMGALMVLLALLSLVSGIMQARFSSLAGVGFAKSLRAALFKKVMAFSFSNVDDIETSSLITRLTTDVQNAQISVIMCLRIAIRAPAMLVFALIMALRLSAQLSLTFAVAIPVIAALLIFLGLKAGPLFNRMLKSYDGLNASVRENLTAIRVVKAFVREDYEKGKFRDRSNELKRAQIAAEKMLVSTMPVMQAVIYLCIVAVLYFGAQLVSAHSLDIGALSTFVSYITQILTSLMMLAMIFIMVVQSRASLDRIAEVLDTNPDIVSPEGGITELSDGSVELRSVSFAYKQGTGENVLHDVSLKIKSGEKIGIIGATGSSKSTLVQLIPRFYDATQGEVIVGGHDVRKYDLKALRKSVAMVLQQNVLFSGTVRENLLWGDETADDMALEHAAKAACAHEFITAMPDGYDTKIERGGTNLSGGQRQRMCIARALVAKPKIMIMDDSTSAVDTATDARIRHALRTELKSMTAIIIAQRISSVMDLDRIVVLDGGRLSDVGTHDELMQRCAIYRDVYESQNKGGER